MVEDGRLRPEEAATHPQRLLLLRALDGSPATFPDIGLHEVRRGDRYLLCSDGLSGAVPAAELRRVLASAAEPEQAVRDLVALANDAGRRGQRQLRRGRRHPGRGLTASGADCGAFCTVHLPKPCTPHRNRRRFVVRLAVSAGSVGRWAGCGYVDVSGAGGAGGTSRAASSSSVTRGGRTTAPVRT